MANGTTITDILNQWADFGIFAYVLPFLLIFAVVFGILEKAHILGKNRAVHATIAVTTGLLSLQFDYVSEFFAGIFPYAGIGIAVLLVAVILIGLLNSDTKGEHVRKWMLFAVGAITFFTILYKLWDDYSYRFGWSGGGGDSGIWNMVWTLVFIAAIITIAITSSRSRDKDEDKPK